MGRLTVKGVAEQLRKHHGVQTGVAKAFGVTRSAVTQYMDAHPELREIQNEGLETALDLGESALFSSVIKREPWAVKYLLSTKGKSRGYVERHEHQHDFSKMTDEQLRSYIKNGLAGLSAGHSGGAEEGD